MHSIRKVTTGLVLAVSLSTVSVGLADAASAAPVQPAAHTNKIVPIKSYRTWEAAQKAAGFPLLKPTRTFGLKLRPGILVLGCLRQIPLHPGKRTRQVLAMYRGRRGLLPALSFSQGRTRHVPCAMPPFPRQAKIIAKVRVDGVVAILSRAHAFLCILKVGSNKKPTCTKFPLWQLTWSKHGHFYRVMSPTKAGRIRVVGFARSLVPVS
jgi:hypothetical protein